VKARSPLAEAKKVALAAFVGSQGGAIVLSDWVYSRLRESGLSRADVNGAVDALVGAGEAALDNEDRRVIVRLLPGGAE